MKSTDFIKKKNNHEKISMITAYNYPMAKMAEDAGIDTVLVGDSLGMVMLGYGTTIPVTMDEMILHTKSVSKACNNTFVVADMPFMSYQINVNEAIRNVGRLIKEGGANAVKLEGGSAIAETIRKIIDIGIPVIGHIGMTPQSCNALGGFKAQGKNIDRAIELINESHALEDAGCIAIVLELIPAELAEIITNELTIPTIGIGSGVNCDGQVQVMTDLLGFSNGFMPKHAKKYADMYEIGINAIKDYISDINTDSFPSVENSPHIENEMINLIKKYKD